MVVALASALVVAMTATSITTDSFGGSGAHWASMDWTRFLRPPVSVAELRRLAEDGTLDGPPLSSRVLSGLPDYWGTCQAPGRLVMYGQASPRQGSRSDEARYGWPSAWITIFTWAWYENALEATGVVSYDYGRSSDIVDLPGGVVQRRPAWSWHEGNARYSFPRERLSTRERELMIDPPALAIPVLLLVAAWHVTPVLGRLTAVPRRPAAAAGARRARRACAVAVLAAAIAGTAALLPRLKTTIYSAGAPGSLNAPPRGRLPVQTELDVDAVRALAVSSGGEERLARVLLESVSTPDDSWLVGVEFVPDTLPRGELVSIGWPLTFVWLGRDEEILTHTDAAGSLGVWPKGPSAVRFTNGTLEFIPARDGSSTQLQAYTIQLPAVAFMLLALWMLWVCTGAVCRVIWWARVGRRARRRLCVECGYDLRGLLDAPAVS